MKKIFCVVEAPPYSINAPNC